MPVPNAKATMFFAQGSHGWSESHYCETPNPGSLQAILNEAIAFMCKYRSQLLGGGAQLIGVRASFDEIWRDSLVENFSGQSANVNVVAPSNFSLTNPADNPWYVTTVRLNMGDAYRKLVYLSGMPASQQPSNIAQYTGGFGPLFKAYFQYLVGEKPSKNGFRWGTKVTTKNEDAVPTPNISGIVYATTPTLSMAVYPSTPIPGLTPGQRVRILGLTLPKGAGRNSANGVFTVQSPVPSDGTYFTVKPRFALGRTPINWSKGYYFIMGEAVKPYTSWSWENQTEKKRGLVTGQDHGRLKNR